MQPILAAASCRSSAARDVPTKTHHATISAEPAASAVRGCPRGARHGPCTETAASAVRGCPRGARRGPCAETGAADAAVRRARPLLLLGLLLAACGDEVAVENTVTAEDRIADGPHPHAILEIRDMGSIRIELLPEIAPKTVDNFTQLAESGFYEGIAFHRVIPGFLIQAGDPASRDPDPRLVGGGGPGYEIPDEFSDFPHTRGVISMANKGRRNSGGSQFFIVHQDARGLDGQFSAFGRVVEGIEIVDAITAVEVDTYGRYGPTDRPYPVSVVIDAVHIVPADAGVGIAGNQ